MDCQSATALLSAGEDKAWVAALPWDSHICIPRQVDTS